MLLPLGLIRNAHLPLRQKISIGSVFCLALVCVAVATVRVCEVGKNMTSTTTSDLTWLALWSLVEAAIAIIIGCAPGFYEATKKARTAKPSSKGSSQSDSSNANSRRTHWRNASRDTHGTAAPPMYSLANNKTQSVIRGNAQSLDEDEGSAIELSRPRPLRHAISVTRSTRMTSERNNTSRSYSLYPVERDSTPLIPPERLSSPVSNESQTDLERDIGVAIARARA
ncbi:hypothetical protein ANO11243_093260 [Dothideomycetidae sp. 11243]|nr:hypothetical protein ANO11243_093260 [fungal sp. No.11243]